QHAAPPSFPTRRSSDLPKTQLHCNHTPSPSSQWNYGSTQSLPSLVRRLARLQALLQRTRQNQSCSSPAISCTHPPTGKHREGAVDRKSTRLNSSHVKIS